MIKYWEMKELKSIKTKNEKDMKTKNEKDIKTVKKRKYKKRKHDLILNRIVAILIVIILSVIMFIFGMGYGMNILFTKIEQEFKIAPEKVVKILNEIDTTQSNNISTK